MFNSWHSYCSLRCKWLSLLLLSGILLAACTPMALLADEATPTEDSASPAIVGGTPSPMLESPVTPEETLSPDSLTPDLSPMPANETPIAVNVTAGQVAVTVSAAAFERGQRIEATVANGLAQSIYTEDMQSDCAVVTLERWDGQQWNPLQGCVLRRAPFVVCVESSRGLAVSLDPSSFNFAAGFGAGEAALTAGTYRLAFAYRLAPEPEGELPSVVHSSNFTLQP